MEDRFPGFVNMGSRDSAETVKARTRTIWHSTARRRRIAD